MIIEKRNSTKNAEVGDIIVYKDGTTTCHDLICRCEGTKKYCSVNLEQEKVKTSRLERIEDLVGSYFNIVGIVKKKDMKMSLNY